MPELAFRVRKTLRAEGHNADIKLLVVEPISSCPRKHAPALTRIVALQKEKGPVLSKRLAGPGATFQPGLRLWMPNSS